MTYDEAATQVVARAVGTPLRIIANRPDTGLEAEYAAKIKEASGSAPPSRRRLASCFSKSTRATRRSSLGALHLSARHVGPYEILSTRSPAIPNAIAAILLDLRDRTGVTPHAYFGWTEGNPITYLLRFLAFFGEGDTAPVAREVLRQAEPQLRAAPADSRWVGKNSWVSF